MVISVTDKAENIVEKGKNAGYQHFSLFPHCVQKPFLGGSLDFGMMCLRVVFVKSIFSGQPAQPVKPGMAQCFTR